jgi:hypothetical protein
MASQSSSPSTTVVPQQYNDYQEECDVLSLRDCIAAMEASSAAAAAAAKTAMELSNNFENNLRAAKDAFSRIISGIEERVSLKRKRDADGARDHNDATVAKRQRALAKKLSVPLDPISVVHMRATVVHDAHVIDVTSKATDEYQQLSPFFPHGGIEVPGMPGMFSQSWEGVWQGLKVFVEEGVDTSKFKKKTMKGLKRNASTKRGAIIGHHVGDKILTYIDARHMYVKGYIGVIRKHCMPLLEKLVGLLDNAHMKPVVLRDYGTNGDIYNTTRPLSHAALIIEEVERMHSARRAVVLV